MGICDFQVTFLSAIGFFLAKFVGQDMLTDAWLNTKQPLFQNMHVPSLGVDKRGGEMSTAESYVFGGGWV